MLSHSDGGASLLSDGYSRELNSFESGTADVGLCFAFKKVIRAKADNGRAISGSVLVPYLSCVTYYLTELANVHAVILLES